MGSRACCRRWLFALFFVAALLSIFAKADDEDSDGVNIVDEDDDVFEDPDQPMPARTKKEEKKKKPEAKGAAKAYNVDGSRKKRAYDHDDIDDIVMRQQEDSAHEAYEKAANTMKQVQTWGGIDDETLKDYNKAINQVQKELLEVWEEGKPSERTLMLLGNLARRETKQGQIISDKEMEEMLAKAITFYYAAAQRHNSTEGIYHTGKTLRAQAGLRAKQGDQEKAAELNKKALEFFGSSIARGSFAGMSEASEMCIDGTGFEGNKCPFEMQRHVVDFYENVATQSPNALAFDKVAYVWSVGMGKDKVDMPEACKWNRKAVEANDKVIKDNGGKVKIKELEKSGISLDAYFMRAACQYCGDYSSVGSPDTRLEARNTLKKVVRLQGTAKAQREAKISEYVKEMMGPVQEPEYVVNVQWDRDVDGFGVKWFSLMWLNDKHNLAFIYASARRETYRCQIQVFQGEKDSPPIFECADGSKMRLTVTDKNDVGGYRGTCHIHTESGLVSGVFDMDSPVPRHVEL